MCMAYGYVYLRDLEIVDSYGTWILYEYIKLSIYIL
jgi:hypothetical protein